MVYVQAIAWIPFLARNQARARARFIHPSTSARPPHFFPFFFFFPLPPSPPAAPPPATAAAGVPTTGIAGAASSSTAAVMGAALSPPMLRPSDPSICTRRPTSAAFAVLYLRHTPLAGSVVLRISLPRGGLLAASGMGVSVSVIVVVFLAAAARAFAGVIEYFVVIRVFDWEGGMVRQLFTLCFGRAGFGLMGESN